LHLWDRIRQEWGGIWADWQSPRVDQRTQLITWLAELEQAEQALVLQLQQVLPLIPYEQFRQDLKDMAHDDAQHAACLQACSQSLGALQAPSPSGQGMPGTLPNAVWPRLQRVLGLKREIYERYHQVAGFTDDPTLQSRLEQLRADEARHQDQLITMLTQLDAHVHETIT
jgi:hypothetical protein